MKILNIIKRLFKKEEFLCPVCQKHYFKSVGKYEICPVCSWEDDPIQRKDRDFKGGANKLSLNEAIKAYKENNYE